MAKGQARVKRTSTRATANAKVVEAQSPAPAEATPNALPDPLSKLASLFGGARKPSTSGSPVSVERDYAPPPLDELPPALQENGRCWCWNRTSEKKLLPTDPVEVVKLGNPFHIGHDIHCVLWMERCPDCGHMNGTHVWNCPWWSAHPEQTPF